MAKDLTDAIGTELGRLTRETMKSVSQNTRKRSKGALSSGALSGGKGVAAGVGLAALAPLAAKGMSRVAKGAGQKLASNAKDAVSDQAGNLVDKAGGAGGIAKEAGKSMLPGGGGDGDGKSKSKGLPGVGKGRRLPVQQDIDIGVPLKVVYNQWTQFEEWPKFMHRLQSVSQEDEAHVTFKTKIWGISRDFKAEIDEQRPDERIKWHVVEGLTHSGVVTFHELGPRLTRVELNLDVEPGGLIEKAARGMRHVKRAVRADLARFKAYGLMEHEETGSWRGTIEDGDVKSTKSRSSSSSSSQRSRSATNRGRSASKRSRSTSSSNGRSRLTRASSSSGSASKRGGSSGSSSNGRSSAKRSSAKRSSGRKTTSRS
jgi:uncharacterized membrane protein